MSAAKSRDPSGLLCPNSPRVAILAFNGVSLFELACAVELFALPRPEFEYWYRAEVITLDSSPLRSTAGLTLSVHAIDSLQAYDMLVIPSWSVSESTVENPLAEQVIQFCNEGKRIISFCSGAFLLAELSLLDGRQATTHWQNAECFSRRYGRVQYLPNVLYTWDGQLGCSAGSAAALDLGLEIIRHDYGNHMANQVARRLVVFSQRPGGQAQFAESVPDGHVSLLSGALNWAMDNLAKPISIEQFADRAGMSRRSFDRHFRSALNTSPKIWLTEQRLQLARDLLEEGKMSIDRVAEHSGFENAITLRHHFRRAFNVSPGRYREAFHKS